MNKENVSVEGTGKKGVVTIGANWQSTVELFRQLKNDTVKLLIQTGINIWALKGKVRFVEQDDKHQLVVFKNSYPPGWCSVFSRIYSNVFAFHVYKEWKKVNNAKVIVCFVQPHLYWKNIVSRLLPEHIIYYCVDDYRELWPDRRKRIEEIESEIIQNSSLVVCASQYMTDEFKRRLVNSSEKIIHVPNGTFSHYIVPAVLKKPYPLPDDLKDLKRPVIGYLGNIEGRIDWKIMVKLAESIPFATILIIGPYPSRKHPDYKSLLMLLRFKNCIYLGPKPQEEIMKYICSFDICIIPEPLRPLNVAGCPQKLWNYLASSRPIVSTAVPEQMLWQPAVKIADGAESFVKHIMDLINNGCDDGRGEERLNIARNHTWEKLGECFADEMKKRGII